jgi:membrane protease YdiL (CAAX protease family)
MVQLILALAILLWAPLTRKPWGELGLARPRSWITSILVGIGFGVAFKFCMKAIVMPLLGTDPVNHAYHYLAGNPTAVAGFVVTILFGAGFSEELIFRGYLFERLGKLLGSGLRGTVLTVVITSLLFGSGHYANLGWPGVQQAFMTGLVFGAIYARTRSLWMLMIAHAAFDLTAVWMIYNGLEERFAHLIFK